MPFCPHRRGWTMEKLTTKTCPGCGVTFTLQEIVENPEVKPLGMQFVDPALRRNVYYFNHAAPGCGTTFVIPVSAFRPFIAETIPDTVLAGSADCGHHCTTIDDMVVCKAACCYAPFRRFLLRLRERTGLRSGSAGVTPACESSSL